MGPLSRHACAANNRHATKSGFGLTNGGAPFFRTSSIRSDGFRALGMAIAGGTSKNLN